MFRRVVSLAVVGAMVMAACGGDDDDPSSAEGSAATAGGNAASGEPIVLGAVASLSGVDIFPESPAAAQAVFDRFNAEGGLDGRPVEYLVEDDGNTAEQAATAAKRLVEDRNVLGMVGGGSIVDCTTNAKYYAEQDVYDLAGVNACTPDVTHVASINTGPFIGTQVTLSYMIEEMGVENVCFSGLNVPLTDIFKNATVPEWEQVTGYKLHSMIISEPNEDLTAAVTKAKTDGCDGVLLAYTEPNYIAYYQIADAQGLVGDLQYSMLTSGYSLNVLDKVGNTAEGTVTNSEFLPYTDDEDTTPELVDFKELMEASDLELTSFAQGGYISANIAIEALRSIEGDITRESVGEAFQNITYTTPLLGAPFEFGPQPNRSSQIVQIEDGKFVTVSGWLKFPPS
ncbi:MAG: ABC transporter substrate-binding protein [Acidimicrobiia bacterium]|nr:ABC transporter substrate-binding protein [Acidimicrobiia bacterium]